MLKKATALFVVCVSLATWIGCGTTTSRYVYAAIPAASQIAEYREDPNSGILTALVGSPIAAGPGVASLVLHPSKKFLYGANSGLNTLSVFTIASGGVLTEQTPRPTAGTAPSFLAMDPAGSFLYVGNVGSNDISVLSIDGSTGALTPVGSSIPIGIAPLNMKLSPSGSVLYITGATGGAQGIIEAFNVSAGALTPVQGSPFLTGRNPAGLAIDPSGAHLYTANSLDNSISIFTIGSDGSLSELSGSPIGETYSAPRALLVDNSGKYLYVANGLSSNMAAYTIGSDGGLTILSGSPFTTGAQPTSITSDPSGKYLFVGNQSSPVVQSFSVNTSSGVLTSVATYSVGNTPTSIVISQ